MTKLRLLRIGRIVLADSEDVSLENGGEREKVAEGQTEALLLGEHRTCSSVPGLWVKMLQPESNAQKAPFQLDRSL